MTFWSYRKNQKGRIKFLERLWSGDEKYFCLLFSVSGTPLQRLGESDRLLQRNF